MKEIIFLTAGITKSSITSWGTEFLVTFTFLLNLSSLVLKGLLSSSLSLIIGLVGSVWLGISSRTIGILTVSSYLSVSGIETS